MGIEPTAQAWEAWVLPLYDARLREILVALRLHKQIGPLVIKFHQAGGELALTALPIR